MLGCIQPMSSPMMNMMLGFFSCAWAVKGAARPKNAIAHAVTAVAPRLDPNFEKPLISLLLPTKRSAHLRTYLLTKSLAFACREWGLSTLQGDAGRDG